MAKDPAFNFYTNDFDQKTKFFSHEQVGMYLRLLMAQHQHGHLTESQMMHICGRYDEDVFSKFSKDPAGKFFNDRLDHEIAKRRNYSESRKQNRNSKRDNTSKTHVTTHDKHMSAHMENENEIENEIREEIKKEPRVKVSREAISKFEIFEMIFSDEIYIEQLAMTHRGKDIKQAFEECYTHHANAPNPPRELWEWKQKLNTWLSIKKVDKNGISKKTDAVNSRREAFAKRHSTGS